MAEVIPLQFLLIRMAATTLKIATILPAPMAMTPAAVTAVIAEEMEEGAATGAAAAMVEGAAVAEGVDAGEASSATPVPD